MTARNDSVRMPACRFRVHRGPHGFRCCISGAVRGRSGFPEIAGRGSTGGFSDSFHDSDGGRLLKGADGPTPGRPIDAALNHRPGVFYLAKVNYAERLHIDFSVVTDRIPERRGGRAIARRAGGLARRHAQRRHSYAGHARVHAEVGTVLADRGGAATKSGPEIRFHAGRPPLAALAEWLLPPGRSGPAPSQGRVRGLGGLLDGILSNSGDCDSGIGHGARGGGSQPDAARRSASSHPAFLAAGRQRAGDPLHPDEHGFSTRPDRHIRHTDGVQQRAHRPDTRPGSCGLFFLRSLHRRGRRLPTSDPVERARPGPGGRAGRQDSLRGLQPHPRCASRTSAPLLRSDAAQHLHLRRLHGMDGALAGVRRRRLEKRCAVESANDGHSGSGTIAHVRRAVPAFGLDPRY